MQNLANDTLEIKNRENVQIVSFNLGKEEFALDISHIQEIIRLQTITPIPLTKNYILGVINIRGSILPVLDLRIKMNFECKEFDNHTRIIVISFDNRKVGLIVDNMNEVIRTSTENLNIPPIKSEEGNDRFVESVYINEQRIITVLDIKSILDKK